VKPVREPDAGDPQVRFDERRWETELWPRLRHRHQSESRRQQRLPRPTDTAPAADSTSALSAPVGEALAAAAETSGLEDDALAAELQSWFRLWVAEGFFQTIA